MKNKIIFGILGIVLVLSTIVLAEIIFLDEDAAINFRNNFVDYPEIIGQAEITRISARLDDENIIFEWRVNINNKRDGTTEELMGAFEIPKADKDNAILIQNTLTDEVNREFEDLNKTFIPNPLVEYRSHPSWGKVFTIALK